MFMDKEIYLFLGAAIGGLFAYVSAMVGARSQRDIARLNANKDIALQRDRLNEERYKNELTVEREKLDILHRILSKIALENSQTMSNMQSSAKLEVPAFRERYLENCGRLHEAMAIVDIYYPQMGGAIREIYSQSNVFWGYQENLLQIDLATNSTAWSSQLQEVLKACDVIGLRSGELKDQIAARAKQLTESIAE